MVVGRYTYGIPVDTSLFGALPTYVQYYSSLIRRYLHKLFGHHTQFTCTSVSVMHCLTLSTTFWTGRLDVTVEIQIGMLQCNAGREFHWVSSIELHTQPPSLHTCRTIRLNADRVHIVHSTKKSRYGRKMSPVL